MSWQTSRLAAEYDLLAPDGSEIRLLLQVGGGSLVHCRLPPGQVTQAVRHRSVEEVWFCVGGAGQIWRRDANSEDITDLEAGVSVSVPVGIAFQFRATGSEPLQVVITTLPPWPGPDEAIFVDEGAWPPSAAENHPPA